MIQEDAAPGRESLHEPLQDSATYRRVEKSVRRIVIARRWHLSPETQDDVSQQTLAELLTWTHRNPGASADEILTCAKRIACWRCLDESRKIRTRYSVPLDPETRSPAPDPLQELLRTDQTARVRLAIDRLPDGDRLLIRQRVVDELRHEDIAKAEGVPVPTIRTRWNRCLKRLREELRQLGDPEVPPPASGRS